MKTGPLRVRRRRASRLASPTLLLLLAPVLAAQERDLAALVNPKNPEVDLTRGALTNLFRAETRYWRNGRRVEILLPRSGSPERDFLLENVYRMSEAELKRYWIELIYRNKITAPPKVMPSAAVLQVVLGKQDGGIGLVPAEDVRAEGVTVAKVDGKKPGDDGYWLRVPDEREHAGQEQEPREASWEVADDQDELRQRLERLELELAGLGADDDLDPTFRLGGLDLRGFGDVTASVSKVEGDGRTEFALGQLDLFMTARLSERSHFLGELVIETDSDGETVADIERLVVSYDIGQNATVSAGRIHTALGQWNSRFHHGEWLQTTIERPRIVEFEDDGGILPVHQIGVMAEVHASTRPVEVDVCVGVANGRGPVAEHVQSTGDLNDAKSLNLQVVLRPNAVRGLALGGGAYSDDIPANGDASAGPVHGPIDERIYSVFGSWSGGETSFLTEFYRIEHEDGASEADSRGWFAQLEHELGEWTPYLRYESLSIADGDPYFADTTDEERVVLGVRWDFSTWNAFKLQFESGQSEATGEDFEAVLFQTAFAF